MGSFRNRCSNDLMHTVKDKKPHDYGSRIIYNTKRITLNIRTDDSIRRTGILVAPPPDTTDHGEFPNTLGNPVPNKPNTVWSKRNQKRKIITIPYHSIAIAKNYMYEEEREWNDITYIFYILSAVHLKRNIMIEEDMEWNDIIAQYFI